jgi:hypothetical protein
MKNVGLGFLLLASAELCSAHRCLAQERPKRAGTRNRVVAALTWPVRAYYFETKQTFRDMRNDQMLRAEAAALFGSAAFENATLEVSYRQNPTTKVGNPARFFVGRRPHGAQLWLVSGVVNVALLDAAHYLGRDRNNHRDRDGLATYGSMAGILGLSGLYTVAGIHNLNLKNEPISFDATTSHGRR